MLSHCKSGTCGFIAAPPAVRATVRTGWASSKRLAKATEAGFEEDRGHVSGERKRALSSRRRVLQQIGSAAVLFTAGAAADPLLFVPTAAADDSGGSSEKFQDFSVEFGTGPLGLQLVEAESDDTTTAWRTAKKVVVEAVLMKSQAVMHPTIRAGQAVVAVNGLAVDPSLRAKQVKLLIQTSPRPLTITFRDFNPKDNAALQAETRAKAGAKKSEGDAEGGGGSGLAQEAAADTSGTSGPSGTAPPAENELQVKRVRPGTACGVRTRTGDLIEIKYTARIGSIAGREFDSSNKRGLQSFAFTLGNGEVLKGLELACYDMCIGERRKIDIPPRLAFGEQGSKAYGVPSNTRLVYGVELTAINLNGSPVTTRADNYYTGAPCSEGAFKKGTASGNCVAVEDDY